MSPEKIKKLREAANLTDKGDIAESMRRNAREILANNGIDWRFPQKKESLFDKAKATFGGNIRREYRFEFSRPTDILLLVVLHDMITDRDFDGAINGNMNIIMRNITPAEHAEITRLYRFNRPEFHGDMYEHAMKYANIKYS